jgi:hypothetical protein
MKQVVTIALILAALALTATEVFAGVTAIKGVQNNTPYTIRIQTTESTAGGDIPSGATAGFDIWIPWATNSTEFQGHHIWIEVPWGTIKWVIWQSNKDDGDWVRYNSPPYYPPASQGPGKHVPGCAYVDGNRLLEVYSDHIKMDCIRSVKARRMKHVK